MQIQLVKFEIFIFLLALLLRVGLLNSNVIFVKRAAWRAVRSRGAMALVKNETLIRKVIFFGVRRERGGAD